MATNELKKKEFKRTARANMVASLRLEGIKPPLSSRTKSISELKAKYAR
ncbi:YhfG family protein [Pleionea sp. CnH1-48]